MYHFTDGGLRNVYLANGYEVRKTPYGKSVSIQDVDGLTKAICRVLVRKKAKLTGAEFRYLRLAMLMSQKSLAQYLGKTDQSIAIWEKKGTAPKMADSLIRLIYSSHIKSNESYKNIVRSLNETEREMYIIMQDSKTAGWKGSTQDSQPTFEHEPATV